MKQELIEYGLSEKEAEIFIVCIKTGEATANRIAEISKFPRSTTYDVLEKLRQQSLITTFTKQNKIHFVASNPEILITTLEEKKRKIQDILPQIKEIQNKVGAKPVAEVFQGKIAVIKLLDEILDNAKNLKVIGSQGNALEKIGYHPEKFRVKRLEKQIKIQQILEVSKESKKIKNDKLTEVRFSKNLNNSREATFIFNDYVYHIILQYDISAIKIKSKDHANSTRIMFDEMWKKSNTLL